MGSKVQRHIHGFQSPGVPWTAIEAAAALDVHFVDIASMTIMWKSQE
jgi:hypothetical protein